MNGNRARGVLTWLAVHALLVAAASALVGGALLLAGAHEALRWTSGVTVSGILLAVAAVALLDRAELRERREVEAARRAAAESEERESTSDTPPADQHEARLLAAVAHDGVTATILAYEGDIEDVIGVDELAVEVKDLEIASPAAPGLHVWEGDVVEGCPRADGGFEPDILVGTWRRATPAEAQRYAASEPVWGSR